MRITVQPPGNLGEVVFKRYIYKDGGELVLFRRVYLYAVPFSKLLIELLRAVAATVYSNFPVKGNPVECRFFDPRQYLPDRFSPDRCQTQTGELFESLVSFQKAVVIRLACCIEDDLMQGVAEWGLMYNVLIISMIHRR